MYTGYIFKPTHEEIHYTKSGSKLIAGDDYSMNFTTNIEDAQMISDEVKAKNEIVKLVSMFEKDDDYNFTPVFIVDNKRSRFLNNVWEKI